MLLRHQLCFAMLCIVLIVDGTPLTPCKLPPSPKPASMLTATPTAYFSGGSIVSTQDESSVFLIGSNSLTQSAVVQKFNGNDLTSAWVSPLSDGSAYTTGSIGYIRTLPEGDRLFVGGQVSGILPSETAKGGSYDGFVSKVDAANGNFIWSRQVGLSVTDLLQALHVNKYGSVAFVTTVSGVDDQLSIQAIGCVGVITADGKVVFTSPISLNTTSGTFSAKIVNVFLNNDNTTVVMMKMEYPYPLYGLYFTAEGVLTDRVELDGEYAYTTDSLILLCTTLFDYVSGIPLFRASVSMIDPAAKVLLRTVTVKRTEYSWSDNHGRPLPMSDGSCFVRIFTLLPESYLARYSPTGELLQVFSVSADNETPYIAASGRIYFYANSQLIQHDTRVTCQSGTADACYVCGGNNSTCSDCAGKAWGFAVYDACGVCGGAGLTCNDCAGTPNGGLVYDACGVCGGHNDTCVLPEEFCAGDFRLEQNGRTYLRVRASADGAVLSNDGLETTGLRILPTTEPLPACGPKLRGSLRIAYGGTGQADVAYVCLKSEDGSYSWVTM